MNVSTVRSAVKTVLPVGIVRRMRRLLALCERLRAATFKPHTIVKTLEGESFPLYIGDPVAEQWYDNERPSAEMRFIRDCMLLPNDLAFDVGCHHGCSTVFLARHAALVVAVEPNPTNVVIIGKNIALNDLSNVRVCHAAAGHTPGKIEIQTENSNARVLLRNVYEIGSTEVDVVPLDDLAQEYGFPSFLKIDVEGFEAFVLKGARQILKRHPKIALEVHNSMLTGFGSSLEEVLGLLDLETYRVWFSKEDEDWPEPWEGRELSPYERFHLYVLP